MISAGVVEVDLLSSSHIFPMFCGKFKVQEKSRQQVIFFYALKHKKCAW